MVQENDFLVERLKQELDKLKKLLSYFDGAELSDKFPDKTQRLNRAISPIESDRIMRRAMESRHMFIKAALDLYSWSPETIGIDKMLLNSVGEILNYN